MTGPPIEASLSTRVGAALRDVPDFPRLGIQFKDVTTLLADSALFAEVIAAMAAPFRESGVTHVAGIESRGFILGAPVAIALGAGFIPIRKPGKLPWQTFRQEYALEYGVDCLEIHVDACGASGRVLLVDDVLATGGTAAAALELIRRAGATVVGCAILLAITALHGRDKLGAVEPAVLLDV